MGRLLDGETEILEYFYNICFIILWECHGKVKGGLLLYPKGYCYGLTIGKLWDGAIFFLCKRSILLF